MCFASIQCSKNCKMRLRLELHPAPRPRWGAHSAPLDPLAGLKKRREGEGEGECREGKGGKGGKENRERKERARAGAQPEICFGGIKVFFLGGGYKYQYTPPSLRPWAREEGEGEESLNRAAD